MAQALAPGLTVLLGAPQVQRLVENSETGKDTIVTVPAWVGEALTREAAWEKLNKPPEPRAPPGEEHA